MEDLQDLGKAGVSGQGQEEGGEGEAQESGSLAKEKGRGTAVCRKDHSGHPVEAGLEGGKLEAARLVRRGLGV